MNYQNYNDDEPFVINDYLDEKARKKRIKEEKKRRKSYKFSDKEHSKRGIISSLCALFALIVIIVAIIVSTSMKGQGTITIGMLAALGLLAAVAGFIIGAFSFKETDSIMRYSWIGLISNGVIFLLLAAIVIGGI